MSEKIMLFRKPRPPTKTYFLLHHQRNVESRTSNQFSNEVPFIPSSVQDGLQSPVPTIRSEFEPDTMRKEPVKFPHRKAPRETSLRSASTNEKPWSRKGAAMPYKPRGPDPFPIRLPRQPLEVKTEYLLPDDSHYYKAPDFSLDDFLLNNKAVSLPKPILQNAVFSKANYVKLTKILQNVMTGIEKPHLAMIDMSNQWGDMPQKKQRIPKRQLLIELKKVIQEKLEEHGMTSSSRLSRSEDKLIDILQEVEMIGVSNGIGMKSQMQIFMKTTEQVLQGSKQLAMKSEEDDTIITPSELSILNCLMEGGYVLSLKAHFIRDLPDLSPIHETLLYLNLSFNEFLAFPRDVLNCRNLHILKLRDNPLQSIPCEIDRLQSLRTLILSFCCFTSLPTEIFNITTLEYLDLSYNKLPFLPVQIKNLVKLRFLNVEGNELRGLPCGLLRINLFRIRIRNNYMSPVFWRESSTNSPQRLSDVCCHFIRQNANFFKKLPEAIELQLAKCSACDCCRGPRYGEGLRIIRPCTEIWRIRRLPFIFQSCSPSCYSEFIRNTDPRVADIIYGVIGEQMRAKKVAL